MHDDVHMIMRIMKIERNEEGRDCGSLGHCEVASETPQEGSWMHGDVLQPSSHSSSPRRLKDGSRVPSSPR